MDKFVVLHRGPESSQQCLVNTSKVLMVEGGSAGGSIVRFSNDSLDQRDRISVVESLDEVRVILDCPED